MAQDLLEAEHVATVDQVVAGKGVAESVRRAAAFEAGSRLEALEDLLDAVVGKPGAKLGEEDGLVGLASAARGQVAADRPPRAETDGHPCP